MITNCNGCEHLSSDSGYDSFWWICVHDEFGFEGKTLEPSLATPEWCPLNKVAAQQANAIDAESLAPEESSTASNDQV